MLFQWTPVSANQIRLLRWNNPLPSGELSFAVEVHNLKDVPQYAAISYVIGPSSEDQPVYVNGRTLMIRKSALDALHQVRRIEKCQRVWIDCLCIRQSDEDEKSQQVQNLGRIYGGAACVYLCADIGDVSLTNLQHALSSQRGAEESDKVDVLIQISHYEQLLESLSRDQSQSIMQEVDVIGSLPHWDRQWIIQEICLSKHVVFCHGSSILPWSSLVSLLVALCHITDKKNHSIGDADSGVNSHHPARGGLDRFLQEFKEYFNQSEHKPTIPAALQKFKEAKCSLPLDKIYALREVAQWPKSWGPIYPDYTISPFELALRTLQFERQRASEIGRSQDTVDPIQFVTDLLEALELDTRESGFDRRLSQRAQHAETEEEGVAVSETSGKSEDELSAGKYELEVDPQWICSVREDAGGRLEIVSDFADLTEGTGSNLYVGTPSDEQSETQRQRPSRAPRPLLSTSDLIGWIAPSAQPGDFLVRLFEGPSEIGVVLRKASDASKPMRIIGYSHFRAQPAAQRTPADGLTLLLHIDPEDLLVMATLHLQEARSHTGQFLPAEELVRYPATRSRYSSFGLVGAGGLRRQTAALSSQLS